MKGMDPPRKCKDCECWYGAEDDEVGPCTVKHRNNKPKYLTHGSFVCDEDLPAGYRSPCKPQEIAS